MALFMTVYRLAVISCSTGRPDFLLRQAETLAQQSSPAERLVFVVPDLKDVGGDAGKARLEALGGEVLLSPRGLTKQRNIGLDHIADTCDLVVFYDDDFVPSRFALARIRDAFAQWPEVSGMTGHVIQDGIHNSGISADEANALVRAWDTDVPADAPFKIIRRGLEGLYGCNMAMRVADIGTIRFDPRLPLYGWQEDIDFAAQLPGDKIKTDAFAGVHMGAKSGRETSGKKLGYSQLANTWYLWRKGTMSARFAGKLALRNTLANHLKMFRPEPWIDRKARAAGNRLALWEILTGRAKPERILEF
jgi:GT2 family glycosyltransferase